MPGGEQLSRKQDLAIAALLTEPTINAAAQKVGVTTRTLRNWLAEPDFAAEFKERCRIVLDTATSMLSGATESAVECLRRNLECGKAAAEIRAAIGILTHAFQAAELADVVERLDELERRLESRLTPSNGSTAGVESLRNGNEHEPHDCQETP
jgi:hypothetical protein